MTIKSGPAKFMKLARRLISTANIRPFLRVARNFSEADELPAEDWLRLTGRALWESIPCMRPIWKGSISFGLVYIPVAVYPATREEKLSFRQLRSSDLSPIKYKKVAEADSKEVPADQIVKGFEYERGRYVVMTSDDVENGRIESTHSSDITDFAKLEQVDPQCFYTPSSLDHHTGAETA